MKRYLLFLLLLSKTLFGYAQQLPDWVLSPPARTHTYYYRVSQGTGLTEEEAGRKAFDGDLSLRENPHKQGMPMHRIACYQARLSSLCIVSGSQ